MVVKDFLYFKIDRKKKILASSLLLALGFTKLDIANEFYEHEKFTYDTNSQKWKTKFNPENYKAKNFSEEVVNAKTGKTVIKLGVNGPLYVAFIGSLNVINPSSESTLRRNSACF